MRISYLVSSPDTSACDEDSMSDKIDMLPFCGGRDGEREKRNWKKGGVRDGESGEEEKREEEGRVG